MRVLHVLCFCAVLMAVTAASLYAAPNFNAGLSDGLLKFTQEVIGDNHDTYKWTFTNVSGQDDKPWDVIGWSIIPYNIPAPTAVKAPDNWVWKSDSFQVKATEKYHTPPALGPKLGPGPDPKPEQELVFEYTINGVIEPNAENKYDPVAMLAHVGAVTWDEKAGKWKEVKVDWGKAGKLQSWYDIPVDPPAIPDCPPPVPEPATLLLSAIGLAAVIRRRRAS